MKKQYKIQLPKGKKVTMTNVDFKNGVMTVNVELEKDDSNIWDKMIQEYGESICGKKVQKYEPKDGDFVYVKAGYEHIAIFKKEVGEGMYVYANWNMSFSVSKIIIDDSRPLCCIHDLREIRPATEREKKILIDQLAKVNKKWNEETKTIEDVRWRAKDGDFVKIEQEGKLYFAPDLGIGYSEKEPNIGIFKSIEMNKGKELLFCYITLIRDSQYEVLLPLEHEGHTYSVGEVSNLKVSPATEAEKKLLIDKVAEVNKRWNEEKKCLENVRWRAKKGKLYRWVSADGYVKESTDEHGECDNCYYNSGNYFKTEEAAEKVAEQIREIFKNSKAE